MKQRKRFLGICGMLVALILSGCGAGGEQHGGKFTE